MGSSRDRALEILAHEAVFAHGSLSSVAASLSLSTSEIVAVTEPIKFVAIVRVVSTMFKTIIKRFVSKNGIASSIKGVISTIHYHSSFDDVNSCVFIKLAGAAKVSPAFSIYRRR